MIQSRALQPPEDSEDLMSMVQFIESARSAGMIKLNERIRGVMDRLLYLMESFLFEQSKQLPCYLSSFCICHVSVTYHMAVSSSIEK